MNPKFMTALNNHFAILSVDSRTSGCGNVTQRNETKHNSNLYKNLTIIASKEGSWNNRIARKLPSPRGKHTNRIERWILKKSDRYYVTRIFLIKKSLSLCITNLSFHSRVGFHRLVRKLRRQTPIRISRAILVRTHHRTNVFLLHCSVLETVL